MTNLLDAISALVCLVSPEKLQAIASGVRKAGSKSGASAISALVGTPAAAIVVDQLMDAWGTSAVDANELAFMLLAAGHAVAKVANQQSVELVWTGPVTPFVSARRTEQALLQVINSAQRTLFLTSFVAYRVSTIVKALNEATQRSVNVSILLEMSEEHGGAVSIDGLAEMGRLVPTAHLYVWRDKAATFDGGRVHAKVAVADDQTCFITSANLTGYAMERNMEAGVILHGGNIPEQLQHHLQSLIDTRVVEYLEPDAPSPTM